MRTHPEVPEFGTVMCVSAHPDDLEFGAAGTVAALADTGAEVTYVVATRGEAGTNDPAWTPETLAAAREQEQQAAADVLGVKDVVFLDFVDSTVEDSLELRRAVSRQMRRHKPELVIGMKPGVLLGSFLNHPDHRNVGTATIDSVLMGATTRLVFPELLDEGLPEWRGIQELWLMGPGPLDEPSVIVDVTDTVERKIEALRCHRTQLADWDPSEMIRERSRQRGEPAGFDYAEGFARIVRQAPPPARSSDPSPR